jgi:hypothetical protein
MVSSKKVSWTESTKDKVSRSRVSSKIKQNMNIDCKIRKSKCIDSALRAVKIAKLHYDLIDKDMSPKSYLFCAFVLELLRSKPKLDIKKINRKKLMLAYNKWAQARRPGEISRDELINSLEQLEEIIKRTDIEKLNDQVLEKS